MSGWNPPPPHRKLTGDLLYLIVQTLEGKYFHVTGATWGFYVNLSNEEEFNPRPASPSLLSHSLIVAIISSPSSYLLVMLVFIYLISNSPPIIINLCHYLFLTLQRCSSPSSYLLVILVVIILIFMIIINQLVPGGCDHPQQRVQSRAGDRGVQSHNKVPPPSTHIITNIEYCGSCR